MKFSESKLQGCFIIDIEPTLDERGLFARCWCKDEFNNFGLTTELSQCSISFSKSKGTLRGMHYQIEAHAETKIVRCTQGSVFDVIIDLRKQSPTYKHWDSITLSAENHRMLYIPEGIAHGLITLESDTEVFYQISVPYAAEYARGIRWDDPCFNINWPNQPTVISTRDANYPDFRD